MTKKSMAACAAAAIKAGALPRVLKRSRVVDAGCAQPLRDVIIDLCRQAVDEATCQADGLQVHSGGVEGNHQGC